MKTEETMVVAITQTEGAFLALFETMDDALAYYNPEVIVMDGVVGFTKFLFSEMRGKTWARPGLTDDDMDRVWPDRSEEHPSRGARPVGWYVHVWDPVDEKDTTVLLRPTPITKL